MSTTILQVSPAYKPAYIYGGPTMSVAKLSEALAIQGNLQVEVLTTTANGKDELQVETGKPTLVDGVQVTYFERLTKDHTHFSPQLLRALRKIILQKKGDRQLVVHIHSWWNLVTIFSCAIAKHYRIPVVLSPRGMLTNYTLGNRNSLAKTAIHGLIGKRLLKYCHVHATSEQEKQDVLAIVNPKSITVIPNLVQFPAVLPHTNGRTNTTFKLLFLSRIEEKKGLELLLEALAEVRFNFSLTIAGTGEAGYVAGLKNLATALAIDDRITWLGHVGNNSKFDVLAEHDLVVLTSYNENFANVVIESLSVGTPVLLSEQVGLASYVAQKKLGWITALNVGDIRIQLAAAYQNLTERISIAERSPEIIAKDFGPEALVPKYVELYRQVI